MAVPRALIGLGLCLLLLVGAGCKQKADLAVPVGAKAFESAAPELRASWEAAVAADHTNGYAAAYGTLLQMRHPSSLTRDQLQAVNALIDRVTTRLMEGLKKGDPAAKQAADEIAQMDKGARRNPAPER